jgi:SSS family solute:Na+ symporter
MDRRRDSGLCSLLVPAAFFEGRSLHDSGIPGIPFQWGRAMAIPAIVTLVFVATSSVIYSGAKFISEYYNDVPVLNSLTAMCWLIAGFSALYVFVGGLKACAWTDLIWGAALILGGVVVLWFAMAELAERPASELILTKVVNSGATVEDLEKAGAWERLALLNDGKNGEAAVSNGANLSGGKMHMVRPKEDSDIPWTALLIGLWIPNLFYWGLNQYIVQRTLGSKSLAEGQKGIVFAAFLKLIIPFVVVIPGILAFNLFSNDLHDGALKGNRALVAKHGDSVLYQVDADYVKLYPAEAAKVLEANLKIIGGSASLPAGATPELTAKVINDVAGSGVQKDKALVPVGTLKGYDYDSAFPVLVRNLIKPYPLISWFVLAALCGAVISSLASMLNSASTIATMDLYSKFTGVTDSAKLVSLGRVFVVIFVILAALVAPSLSNFSSIFSYIQEFQGFISPGILAVFIFGFFSPRTPRWFGVVGIVTNIIAYAAFKWLIGPWLVTNGWWYAGEIAFLDRMAICFFIVIIMGILITMFKPMAKPVELPVNEQIELTTSFGAKVGGGIVVVLTIALYAVFW